MLRSGAEVGLIMLGSLFGFDPFEQGGNESAPAAEEPQPQAPPAVRPRTERTLARVGTRASAVSGTYTSDTHTTYAL